MIDDEDIFKTINKKNIVLSEDNMQWLPLKKILWILKTAKDNSPANALSPKSISYLVYKFFEEKMTEKSIINTIARAGNFIMKKDNKFYEITRKGRNKLEEINIEVGQDVIYITGEKPWTDRNSRFPEFIDRLKGELLIVDPYYGTGTLHNLSLLAKNRKIKFLTCRSGDGENTPSLSREIINFKKEFKNAQLKFYPKFYELHDRYIISDNYLVIIGNGIRDFGNKECFLIAIPSDKVSEIIIVLKQRFNKKWSKANNLT